METGKITIAILALLIAMPATAKKRKQVKKRKAPAVVVEKSKEELRFEEMLGATQQVMFIDSIVVDKEQFLNAYQLKADAGTITGYNQFFGSEEQPYSVVYVNQLSNKCWFSRNGSLFTADKLGSHWAEATPLEGLGEFQVANYPFVLADGTTLYFAACGEQGLGGLDIYASRYNSETGQYLLAENIGLPFNSPANDYMYAVDELNGIGFFATDRRQPEGKVCIYTFIPNTKRITYSTDDFEESTIRSRAIIERIADTWGDGELRAQTLDRLNNAGRRPRETRRRKDFTFIIDDHTTYHSLDDFRTDENRQRAAKLVNMKKTLEELAANLENIRLNYAANPDDTDRKRQKEEILGIEQEYYQLQSDISQLEKAIRFVEQKNF